VPETHENFRPAEEPAHGAVRERKDGTDSLTGPQKGSAILAGNPDQNGGRKGVILRTDVLSPCSACQREEEQKTVYLKRSVLPKSKA